MLKKIHFGGSWAGFGKLLGNIWMSKKGHKRAQLIFSSNFRFLMDLGRLWGGFREAFRRGLGGVLGILGGC